MLKLTHKSKIALLFFIGINLFFINSSKAQISISTIQEFNNLLNDAVFIAGNYVDPGSDAAVYQTSGSWMSTPKKKNLWSTTLELHFNFFNIPDSQRSFLFSDSDLTFFKIKDAESAYSPTVLGNDERVTIFGYLNKKEVVINTPAGVDMEVAAYPYLQGSVGLIEGSELVVRYSPKISIDDIEYQAFGLGLKYNFSQYIKRLKQNNIHIAGMVVYSAQESTFKFLNLQTDYGDLGLSTIDGKIDTWQFQLSASKEWNKFELMFSSISNLSDFKYYLTGDEVMIGGILPIKTVLNEKLKSIYSTNFNSFGEISGRYQFNHFYIQTSIAFGKFANANVSLQYEF